MKSSLKKSNILPGDICLAVSGGADSVAMLLALYELKTKLNINISVRHFEHGIRGEESVRDAKFVEELCKSLSVPFFMGSGDVIAYAKEKGLSVEEAARKLRYEFLMRTDAAQIATAHTADDNAETVIFNLIRGTGIKGLCGIDEVTEIGGKRIIRPMLGVTRAQVEKFLKERNQSFREDRTNFENEYSRNKIRNEIIPLLEDINEKAKTNINNVSNLLKDNFIFIQNNVSKYLKVSEGGKAINTFGWNKLNEYLIKEIIHTWLYDNLEGAKDVGRRHINAVYDLYKGETGRQVDIPGAVVIKSYDELIIKNDIEPDVLIGECIEIDLRNIKHDEPAEFLFCGQKVIIKKNRYTGQNISKQIYTKCFDCDKMGNTLILRAAAKTDYFTINKQLSKKYFNRFCIDEKIPVHDRENIPTVTVGNHIVWAISYRISEYFKIGDDTRNMLEITVKEI